MRSNEGDTQTTQQTKQIHFERHKNVEELNDIKFESKSDETNGVTFFQDFIAGGVAGSVSILAGHPVDTIKVRLQTSKTASSGIMATIYEFGGLLSLYRGMAAPLATAASVNAVIFGSYGFSSRLYDAYILQPTNLEEEKEYVSTNNHWQKAFVCGAFAGLSQCFIICPMEHIKCRLQVQVGKYRGPIHATGTILQENGLQRLYQGWWSTFWREVPCFAMYFSCYNYLKSIGNEYISLHFHVTPLPRGTPGMAPNDHSLSWFASSVAGGCAGVITWSAVYPFDVIKSRVQTAPLNTPFRDLRMHKIGGELVRLYGVKYLYRGIGVNLVHAFPVNAIIFPVYEFTLRQVCELSDHFYNS